MVRQKDSDGYSPEQKKLSKKTLWSKFDDMRLTKLRDPVIPNRLKAFYSHPEYFELFELLERAGWKLHNYGNPALMFFYFESQYYGRLRFRFELLQEEVTGNLIKGVFSGPKALKGSCKISRIHCYNDWTTVIGIHKNLIKQWEKALADFLRDEVTVYELMVKHGTYEEKKRNLCDF